MNKKPLIGFHVSSADSLELAYDRASELGCTTFQMFTRSPRMWKCKPLSEDQTSAFTAKRKLTDFRLLVDHMPYLPNLASSDKVTMKKSRDALNEEVLRCDSLGLDYLVVHLGSHRGDGSAVGVRNIAQAAKHALGGSRATTILLENMAGQKNCIGARFEELRQILDTIGNPGRTGVCFDTCHAYAAGFDLSTAEAVDQTLGLFDDIVGMKELKVVHLNDSKGVLGSHSDRHEHIGMGKIGREGFRALLGYRGVLDRPIIMETPIDDVRSQEEDLKCVRGLLPDENS
jgi:deoxyribonuclease-4